MSGGGKFVIEEILSMEGKTSGGSPLTLSLGIVGWVASLKYCVKLGRDLTYWIFGLG